MFFPVAKQQSISRKMSYLHMFSGVFPPFHYNIDHNSSRTCKTLSIQLECQNVIHGGWSVAMVTVLQGKNLMINYTKMKKSHNLLIKCNNFLIYLYTINQDRKYQIKFIETYHENVFCYHGNYVSKQCNSLIY